MNDLHGDWDDSGIGIVAQQLAIFTIVWMGMITAIVAGLIYAARRVLGRH